MATKKHSSTRNSASDNTRRSPAVGTAVSYLSLVPANAHPDLVRLAENADELIGATSEARAKRAERKRQRAELAAKEAAGVTLKGKRLKQAEWAVAQINYSAAAIHKLAFEAGGDSLTDTEAIDRYLTALGNIAETICRRCDVVAELLGERGGFGNFAEEFEALTEERAAELERQEAEEAAAG